MPSPLFLPIWYWLEWKTAYVLSSLFHWSPLWIKIMPCAITSDRTDRLIKTWQMRFSGVLQSPDSAIGMWWLTKLNYGSVGYTKKRMHNKMTLCSFCHSVLNISFITISMCLPNAFCNQFLFLWFSLTSGIWMEEKKCLGGFSKEKKKKGGRTFSKFKFKWETLHFVFIVSYFTMTPTHKAGVILDFLIFYFTLIFGQP